MRVWLHETSHASSQLPSTWLLLSQYTTTRGSTMTKRLCLPGIRLRIEECTQCGASSGSSETFGESMAMRLAHVLQIFWLFPFPLPFPFPSRSRSRVSVFSSCPFRHRTKLMLQSGNCLEHPTTNADINGGLLSLLLNS